MEREKDLQERLQEANRNYVRAVEECMREIERKNRAYFFIVSKGLGGEFLRWDWDNPEAISEKAVGLLFDGKE